MRQQSSSQPPLTSSALLSAEGGQVALQGVEITADVTATSSRVRVRQRYVNQEAEPIEATYLFPLEDEAAVVGFRVETGGRVLVGEVQEREQAFRTYDDALLDGHGSYLLDQERPNAFTARVGNLKPGQEATIEVTYLSTLRVEGGRARLLIPTVVAPRYVPAGSAAEEGVSEEERWRAPRAAGVPYGLELRVRVSAPRGVGAVESPSHPLRLEVTPAGAEVSLSSARATLDRDFVLLFDAHPAQEEGAAVLARGPRGEALVSCTFTPRRPEGAPSRVPLNVTFVLDCSGSMDGAPIQEAKRAVGLLMRGLTEGDLFNLCCFGTTYQLMWPEPRSFSQEALTAALSYLKGVDADLGGTELLAPLKKLLGGLKRQERAGTLLVLTDGQVSNEEEVVKECAAHKAHARVFTFGIGAGVSETLVREMARASGGAVELIHTGERVEPKVLRAAKQLGQPSVSLKGAKLGRRALRFADGEPTLFYGESVTFYAELPKPPEDLAALAGALVLRAEEGEWRLPLTALPAGEESPVPALWARAAIRGLERKQGARGARAEVLALAMSYGLMSSQTSFVAVEERAEGEREEGAPAPRPVPLMMLSDHAEASSRDRRFAAYSAPPSMSVKSFAMFAFSSPALFSPHSDDADDADAWVSCAPSPSSSPKRARSKALKASWPKAPDGATLGGGETPEDQLFALLELQRADGRFEWGAALERLLGAAAGQVSAAERAEGSVVTALALALLRERFETLADLWEVAARKATATLAGEGAALTAATARAEALVALKG